ncbi:MAG: acyl-CoA thioesterase [Blastocatellia bacterium]|nr:acyl-CoA thioesterase [Blastocatellia bacterium]
MSEQPKPTEEPKYTYWLPLEVRWRDMDAYGHVNNALYFTYMESARMGYFEVLNLFGFDESGTLMPVVAQAACNFRKQVKHPARLLVGARLQEMRNRSFILEYLILQRTSDHRFEPVADGTSAVVWIEKASGKAVPLAENLRAALENLEQTRCFPEEIRMEN